MAAITDLDTPEIRRTYPTLGIKPLTNQEETFLLQYLRGISIKQAARCAGISPLESTRLLDEDENFRAVLQYYRQKEFHDVKVSRETLTSMLMESYRKAASSMEEVQAVRELIRLHHYDRVPEEKTINININRLETVPEAKLLELAGFDEDLLILKAREVDLGGSEEG